MASLVLGLDARAEDRLLADMIEHGHSVAARLGSAREIIAALDEHRPNAVIVSATRMTLGSDLLAACDRRGIRVIALAADAAERRHAAVLGLHEVVAADAAWPEVEELLGAGIPVPLRAAAEHPARGRGTVIAVWGPAGGPGRSTIAVNIAAEIAASGHSVVLADADSYGGSIAPLLGMLDEAPGFAAACRLGGTGSLSGAELERIAQRYDSPHGSFAVLTGIGRAARWPELGADRVAASIEACRNWREYVVVDVGFCLEDDEEISSDLFAPRRNAATLAVLAAADRVVAVGLADPLGLSRFLRAVPALGEAAANAQITVLLNRVRASAIGLDPHAQLRNTLRRFGGIEEATLVPHDLNALDAAVLDGRTLRDAAPRSPVRTALAALVLEQFVPAPAPQRRPSWRPRARRAAAAALSPAQ
ncbi:MinD-like ATPase involved in chromosome partitioning or flagellar assembly [Microterricola gilva]|uniref:MinD-like ATPase involved in chromosome partitioning or flagellar assembly n=1 Tax=Microterricola gilva TaxID=393267 RepID=A0A4Q8AIW0_9MICO|nr:P-loop NTPase [Microterricola gilva]RZU64397.1 MinD-like ATPase involved in chromosome partitioning or flagellar assembly [Microterricola gilva]